MAKSVLSVTKEQEAWQGDFYWQVPCSYWENSSRRMCPLDQFKGSLYLNLHRDSYLSSVCHEKVKHHESLIFWDKRVLQSPCCGLGVNPVWIAHCVQLWLSKDYRGITHSPPMNNSEPKAEKGKLVQHNQKNYELSQPKVSSLDDSQPGFGHQSKLSFLWLEQR